MDTHEFPKAIEAFKKASADPEYLEQMAKMGLPTKYLGPADFGKLIKAEYEIYSELSKDLGISK